MALVKLQLQNTGKKIKANKLKVQKENRENGR